MARSLEDRADSCCSNPKGTVVGNYPKFRCRKTVVGIDMSLSAKGSDYPIRVGVIGIGRGASLAASANLAGMQLVALCDK